MVELHSVIAIPIYAAPIRATGTKYSATIRNNWNAIYTTHTAKQTNVSLSELLVEGVVTLRPSQVVDDTDRLDGFMNKAMQKVLGAFWVNVWSKKLSTRNSSGDEIAKRDFFRFTYLFILYAPGTIAVNVKWMKRGLICLSNASQHISIYLQPFS